MLHFKQLSKKHFFCNHKGVLFFFQLADGVELLLCSYPQYIKVDSLPAGNLDDKVGNLLGWKLSTPVHYVLA